MNLTQVNELLKVRPGAALGAPPPPPAPCPANRLALAAPRLLRCSPAPLQPLLHKDLRIQCRARGLNPGGSRDALQERVAEHMLATGN